MEREKGTRARTAFRLAATVVPVAALLACIGLLISVIYNPGVAGPTCAAGDGAGACTRILFLGNSLTYVNDLPSTFARLSQSGGHPVAVSMVAHGGETLTQHAAAADSINAIASQKWSYVILQEGSTVPTTSAGRDYMSSAVGSLVPRVEQVGAVPMLFMAFAHKNGQPEVGLTTYQSMQQATNANYLSVARSFGLPVAPVGFTWYMVVRDHPQIGLWQDDGIHPAAAGTYLAACVFYASIFRQSPVGVSYHGGLSDQTARILQDEAGHQVLDLESEWGLR